MVSALMPTLKAKMDVNGKLDFGSQESRSTSCVVLESREGVEGRETTSA
jgi:hypothetical protein